MTIRLATDADLSGMLPLINLAYEVETFLEGPRTTETELQDLLRTGAFFIAEAGADLVACVYTELSGKFPDKRGYFGMLAVSPSRQGTGLGRVMVTAAEQHCRTKDCTHMDITVLSLRPELLPFYRKLGYVQTGVKEFHTTQPLTQQALKDNLKCTCIVMSKAL